MTSFGYHFWFLSTIIQFYLIFPLIFYAKEKLSNSKCILLSLIISICYWILISVLNLSDERVYNSFFMQYLWEFVAGVILADYYKHKRILFWEQNNILLCFMAIIGISTMAIMAMKGGRIGQTFNDIPAALGYTSLSALIFSITSKTIKPLNRLLIFIGGISFELYLTHMVTFILLTNLFEFIVKIEADILVSLVGILPISTLLAYLLHKLFAVLVSNANATFAQQVN